MKCRLCLFFLLPILAFTSEQVLSLGNLGSVRYQYEDGKLQQIDRLSPEGKTLYSHSYNYNQNGDVVSENLIAGLGEVVYDANTTISPYHVEICEYDKDQNLVKHMKDLATVDYEYNNQHELISQDTPEFHVYDNSGDLIQKGEIHFSYDQDHQLVKATSNDLDATYSYDEQGRRNSKTVNGRTERYFHLGLNEIVITDEAGNVKELRIPGLTRHKDLIRAIAIETPDATYAPIHDVQGNITTLIDISTLEVKKFIRPDPFGRGLSVNSLTSWIFAGKQFDTETGLVYFGNRYYCPSLKKWISPDPALQCSDLHQYCFNNPLSCFDPDGKFTLTFGQICWGAGTVISSPLWGTGAIWAMAGVAIGVIAYEGVTRTNQWLENRHNSQMTNEALTSLQLIDKMAKGDYVEPKDLTDQLSLGEAKDSKNEEIMEGKIKDPRFPPDEWGKKQHCHTSLDGVNTEIHFWENTVTGERLEFKFKDYK